MSRQDAESDDMKAGQRIGGFAAMMLLMATLSWAATSPVADAAMRSDLASVRALIKQKADVNAPQVDGATALHWAVHLDNVEMADALVKAGANVKVANRVGATALGMA